MSQEKIARVQELLREAYAIMNEIGYTPNVRSEVAKPASEVEHYERLALLADSPKPGPLPAIGPAIVAVPGAPEEVE